MEPGGAVSGASIPPESPNLATLDEFTEKFADLGNESVMKQAWDGAEGERR
jgi:hypothetical protein